jgi:hypothetical protein
MWVRAEHSGFGNTLGRDGRYLAIQRTVDGRTLLTGHPCLPRKGIGDRLQRQAAWQRSSNF